ncbi:F-box/LRR-repeat protein 2-like isoform X5 [Periplaneta americana]
MLEEVKHVTHLRRHHLHVLLTPLLTNWSSHGIGDTHAAFRLLSNRCKNLKKLNISYLRHINPAVLMGLVPCFCNLVSLNLRMTLTVDQLLGQIGMACPNLLELNLASTPITDRGLVQLCISEDGNRQCQNLLRLIVSDTAVTKAGATVVLQALPKLREFDYDHIFDVLQLVENWDETLEARLLLGAGVRISAETAPPPTRICLTTLVSVAEHVPMEGLEAATRLCPETRTVTLSNAWLPSEALYKLMVLDHLNSISLTNSEGLTLDFHEGVLPLLAVCGQRLQNLILANFTSVDVSGIGQACPVLRNLAFSSIAQYEPIGRPCPEWFNHLKALELWSDPHADLSPYMIRQLLLFCPNMTNMLFKGCEVLNDKLMAEIWQENPMPKLSHVTLDHCHKITGQSLQRLLDAENELAVLRVWSCLNITKYLNLELSHHIKNENLDVYFEWFEYDD